MNIIVFLNLNSSYEKSLYFILLIISVSLSSCELVGDIFKAGVWVGILAVVAVIGLIIYLISKVSGKKVNPVFPSKSVGQFSIMNYDVIIIGAGAAGLFAMKDLAKAGYHVCMLEAAETPGEGFLQLKKIFNVPCGSRRRIYPWQIACYI